MKEGGYLDHIFEVGSCDIDVWGLLKPTSILNICQEAAYMHSTQMGFGFDRLVEQNSAWVLSRVECQLARLPKWHERVRVRTWHKRQSGIFSLIEYMYAFVSKSEDTAYVILRVEDNQQATDILTKNNIQILSPEDICKIVK